MNLLQSVTKAYYKVCQVLQSVTRFITKCVRYYKVGQNSLLSAPVNLLLNVATISTKCDTLLIAVKAGSHLAVRAIRRYDIL